MLSHREQAESLFKTPSHHRLQSSKPLGVITANEQAARSKATGGKTEIVLTRNGYNELLAHLGIHDELKKYRGIPIIVIG